MELLSLPTHVNGYPDWNGNALLNVLRPVIKVLAEVSDVYSSLVGKKDTATMAFIW